VDAPVLIVHGTEDRVVEFEVHAKMLEARLPNAELPAVEGGEHVSIFTHRDMVRTKVKEFFQRHFTE
jgi:alpha-beta hydrolase superfamily lysophospholipase